MTDLACAFHIQAPPPPPLPDAVYTLSEVISATAYGRANTNVLMWPQDNLITDPTPRGGLVGQFCVFYDNEPTTSRISIGLRTRPVASPDGWGAFTLDKADAGLNSGTADRDSHLAPSLAADKFGVLHLAWAGHGAGTDEWRYWHGATAWATHVDSNAPSPFPSLSYMKFFVSNGELFLSGRKGSAGGDAQQVLLWWETTAEGVGTWHTLTTALIDWPGSTGDQQSPYMQKICVEPTTQTVHFSYTWNRTAETKTNHDVYYFRSHDLGFTPLTATFVDVTDAPFALPASNQLALRALSTGENCGLQVHQGLSARPDNTPLIAIYYAPNPPATQLFIVTYLSGAWVRRTVGTVSPDWNLIDAPPNSEYSWCSQPNLVCDATNIWLYHRTNFVLSSGGKPTAVYYKCTDPTVTVWAGPGRLVNQNWGDAAPSHDPVAWATFGKFQLLYMFLGIAGQFGAPNDTPVRVATVTLP